MTAAEPAGPHEPSAFEQAIHAIYAVHPDYMLPYVGAAFRQPAPQVVRVVALGTHAYLFDEDWPAGTTPDPALFAAWFAELRFKFQKLVLEDLSGLASALTKGSTIFRGRSFEGRDSIYLTNAVKVYRPASSGKKASKLTEADFARHLPQWREELRAMKRFGVLPHVLVAFGLQAWSVAYQAFDPSSGDVDALRVRSYQALAGTPHDFVHRLTLDLGEGKEHELLLVCLRHPMGRAVTGGPEWLLNQPVFRELSGLTPGPASGGGAVGGPRGLPVTQPPHARPTESGPARRQVLEASVLSSDRRRGAISGAAPPQDTPAPEERRPSAETLPTKTSSVATPAPKAPQPDRVALAAEELASPPVKAAGRPKTATKTPAPKRGTKAASLAATPPSPSGKSTGGAAARGGKASEKVVDKAPPRAKARRSDPEVPVAVPKKKKDSK